MLALLAGSAVSLAAFAAIELRVAEPMFRLTLFRIRAFTFAIVACLVAAAASLLRGGRYHHAEDPAHGPRSSFVAHSDTNDDRGESIVA